MYRALGAALLAAMTACRPAPSGFILLFYHRYPVAVLGGHSWAPDPDHSRLVVFDGALHVTRTVTGTRLALPTAVAPLSNHELLVSEQTGEGVVFDTTGRPLREWPSPLPVALYAATGHTVVASRSPFRVPTFLPEPDTAPLLRLLDTLGREVGSLGRIYRPGAPYLTQLTNAGAVAADSGGIYYAPLVRDEIRKYTPGGLLRWTTKRGLYPVERDPVYVTGKGPVRVQQAIVNVALAVGPNGRLYVLGGDDSSAARLRLDVLDTATGQILATKHLGEKGGTGAIAVDRNGLLLLADADSLLGAAADTGRELFAPAFALPDLKGDTVRLARYAGKVTLVNFWASWCDPCREEFPHMAELYREFDRGDFEIAAISDDVDRGKMREFARQYRPPFSILVGGGAMRATYHYRGLPYSVLLDRRGRVIERIFGFGGPDEFRDLHDAIAKEVRGP